MRGPLAVPPDSGFKMTSLLTEGCLCLTLLEGRLSWQQIAISSFLIGGRSSFFHAENQGPES